MPDAELSVTNWLRNLEAGHDGAAQKLWDVYFERMVRLVEGRMGVVRHPGVDAEDVALSAFASFCRGVKNQRFQELSDRHGLWRLLVSISVHKLLHSHRDANRLKRGGNFRQIDLDHHSSLGTSAIEQIISREPSPDMVAEFAEQYRLWMNALGTDELTQIAEWKLEGFTNDEIAQKCGRTTRTIERKLKLIRMVLIKEVAANDGIDDA